MLFLLEQLLLQGKSLFQVPLLLELEGLPAAHIPVHILEAAHDAHLSVGHVHPGKLYAEILLRPVGHDAQIVHVVMRAVDQPFVDVFQRQLPFKPRLIDFGHHGTDIVILCLGILHVSDPVEAGETVPRLFDGAVAKERKAFLLHIGDEPHGEIGLAQRFDDSLAHGLVCLHALVLFRDVGNEDVIDPAVGVGTGIVAVIVHPAHSPVPADDAVLCIVHLRLVPADLLLDGFRHRLIIIRVQHALEGAAGERPELVFVFAAEDPVYRVVGIQQLPRLFRLVNKKAAGHVPADLLDDVEVLTVELKLFSKHVPFSSSPSALRTRLGPAVIRGIPLAVCFNCHYMQFLPGRQEEKSCPMHSTRAA